MWFAQPAREYLSMHRLGTVRIVVVVRNELLTNAHVVRADSLLGLDSVGPAPASDNLLEVILHVTARLPDFREEGDAGDMIPIVIFLVQLRLRCRQDDVHQLRYTFQHPKCEEGSFYYDVANDHISFFNPAGQITGHLRRFNDSQRHHELGRTIQVTVG